MSRAVSVVSSVLAVAVLAAAQNAPGEGTGFVPKPPPPEEKIQGRTITEWVGLLKSADSSDRNMAASTLGRIGAPAVPALIEVLQTGSPESRASAGTALAVVGPAARSWGGGTWEEGFRHVWLGYANSNEIYDPADGKWVVKSAGLLKALQVYETLAKNGWLTVDALLAPNPWEPIKYQGFPQKTVAVVTGGDWQWEFDWGPNGATPIEGLLEKVERWLFPSEVGDPFAFSGTGRILGIFSQSPN
ncbi:MAG: HEAT repeat domain-containing protein, partial [Candidatus Brocadiae bacterium]|nr:HEAT repeat domain-containing protein [Candidatus Brocadiia bacterium]